MKRNLPSVLICLCLWAISTALSGQSYPVSATLADNGVGLPGVFVTNLRTNQATITDLDGHYTIQAVTGDTLKYAFIGYETTYGLVRGNLVVPLTIPGEIQRNASYIRREMRMLRRYERKGVSDSAYAMPSNLFGTSPGMLSAGAAVMTDETPTYQVKGGIMNPQEIWCIRRKVDGEFVIYRLPDPGNYTGVEYSAGYGLGWAYLKPQLQSDYAQGGPLEGAIAWQGPAQGEIFSWGPRVGQLSYDGIPTPYDALGSLQLATNPEDPRATRYNPYALLQTTQQFYQTLRLQVPLGNYQAIFLEARHNRNRDLWPGSGMQGHSFVARLPYWSMGDLSVKALSKYERTTGSLMPQGNAQGLLWRGIIGTPITFDNTAGLDPHAAHTQPTSYLTHDGDLRSHAPGEADNPYGLLATLPDSEGNRSWHNRLSVVWNELYWLELGAQGQYDQQHHTRAWGVAPGYAGWPTGRFHQRQLHTTQAQARAYARLNTDLDLFFDYIPFQFEINYDWQYLRYDLNRSDAFGFQSQGTIPYWQTQADEEQTLALNPQRIPHQVHAEVEFGDYDSSLQSTVSASYYTSNTLAGEGHWMGKIGLESNLDNWLYLPTLHNSRVYAAWETTIEEAPLLLHHWAYSTLPLSATEFGQAYDIGELSPAGLLPQRNQRWYVGVNLNMDFTIKRFKWKTQVLGQYQQERSSQWFAPWLSGGLVGLTNAATVKEQTWEMRWRNSFKQLLSMRKGNTLHFNLSWQQLRNRVVEVYEAEVLPLAGFEEVQTVLMPGQPIGAIYGTAFARDDAGRRLIGADGFPLVSETRQIIGNPVPDWLGSAEFRYEHPSDLTLDAILQRSEGGQVWNGTQAYLDYLGRSQQTADLRGTSDYVFQEVTEDGLLNQVPVDFVDASLPVSENRWTRYGSIGVAEEYIQDASFWRLQKLSVAYTYRDFPKGRPIQKIVLELAGYNLWQHTDYTGVDPTQPLLENSLGQGLDLFNTPTTRYFMSHLTLTF